MFTDLSVRHDLDICHNSVEFNGLDPVTVVNQRSNCFETPTWHQIGGGLFKLLVARFDTDHSHIITTAVLQHCLARVKLIPGIDFSLAMNNITGTGR